MKPPENPDPVVARVREARDKLAKACDYDLVRMAEMFKAMQARHPHRIRVPKPSPGASAEKS